MAATPPTPCLTTQRALSTFGTMPPVIVPSVMKLLAHLLIDGGDARAFLVEDAADIGDKKG